MKTEQGQTLSSGTAFTEKRRFTWMPRIDFYILREFMIPFSILIFAFILLFLIADVFNDLDDFIGRDNGLEYAMHYFILRMPGNIRFILPITILLASMYTFANFGRHHELTAMRASGISLMRCGLTIYVVAFLVTGVNFWFNEELVPQCGAQAELLRIRVKKGNEFADRKTKKLQYHSPDKMRSWFIGQFNENGEQKDVRIKFFRPGDVTLAEEKKVPRQVLEAETALYVPGKGWQFDNYELIRYIEGLPAYTHHQEKDEPPLLMPETEIAETPDTIEKTIVLPDDLPTSEIYDLLKENKKMAPTLRNVYSTLFWYRLSFPWVCFLCSFLALPLASKNERSGVFTAIVTAVGVVVVYQVLTEIFMVIGKTSVLPPFIAGTFPTLAFVVYGYFFLIRKAG